MVPYEELFTLVMKWRKYEKYWMDGDFTTLDPEFIDVETEELTRCGMGKNGYFNIENQIR